MASLPDLVAFGEFLRDAREKRGLSLQQISTLTKIPWRHLDALEHGNLARGPSGLYRRAEIRAYSRAIGLDQTRALAEFDHALASSEEPDAVEVDLEELAQPTRLGLKTAAAVGLVVVTGTVGLALWERDVTPAQAAAPSTPALARSGTPSADTVIPSQTSGEAGGHRGPAAGSSAESGVAVAPSAARPSLTSPPGPVAPDTPPPPKRVAERAPEPPAPAPQPPSQEAKRGTATRAAATAAPASAAANPRDDRLVIESDPPGARVTVNGIGWGTTPVTVRNLRRGDNRVRLVKDGFSSEERVVKVASAGPTRLRVSMRSTAEQATDKREQ